MRLKKGDTVLVRRGKDKGKTGKILETYASKKMVKVDGINKVKVHKKNQTRPADSGIFEEFMPIHVSKVGIKHPSKKTTTTRIGYKFDSKGRKKRIMKANSKEL